MNITGYIEILCIFYNEGCTYMTSVLYNILHNQAT